MDTSPAKERGRIRNVQKHFVINTALLSMIDPVRGGPTKESFESFTVNDDILQTYQLKQKFLDSFALICSTSSSGKETASAVCLEQNQPRHTILRVARNHGLSQRDHDGLERILQILVVAASEGNLPIKAESEVLKEVVDLDKDRILLLVEKLEKGGIRRVFREATSRLYSGHQNETILMEPSFRNWVKICPFMTESLSSSGASQLISLVNWASQARWEYPAHLRTLFTFGQRPTPPWMENLYKLARYTAAIKSMVKLAVKQPQLFASIRVQGVEAPPTQKFSLLQDKLPLQKTLKRLIKKDFKITVDKLARRWETEDVEAKLRNACRIELTLHAEMQLIKFYECNPVLVPQMRLMGTSKKACYLCHEFLLLHELRFRVTACHQKIYPTWMPPLYHNIPGAPSNKTFRKLSKKVEKVTIRELKIGLEAAQRPRNKDSTAGPSLTKTATVSTGIWEQHTARRLPLLKGRKMSNLESNSTQAGL